jgi:gentisate 1,2-dioxygenase
MQIEMTSGPLCKNFKALNLYGRGMMFLNNGDVTQGHRHPYDHVTIVARGSVSVFVDGITEILHEDQVFITPAGALHKFTSLADNTALWCIHQMRTPEGILIEAEAITDETELAPFAHIKEE